MRLNPEVFKINARQVESQIVKFIQGQTKELGRKGIVVTISGGLDSTTVLALCVRAVGKNRVTGLMLPEKKGNPDAVKFARLAAKRFGVKTATINITPALKALGVYDFIVNLIPGRELTRQFVKGYMKVSGSNPFIDRIRGKGNALTNMGIASMDTKHRVRMAVVFKYAEERNLLVAGCAHKSEDLLGLFCKFGVDDNADIMPVKNLYRSHILQLAEFTGVPSEIINREPNPDMVPGIEDKYFDVLGVRSDTADLVLHGLEIGMKPAEIARQTAISIEKVLEMEEIVRLSRHMRTPSLAPKIRF